MSKDIKLDIDAIEAAIQLLQDYGFVTGGLMHVADSMKNHPGICPDCLGKIVADVINSTPVQAEIAQGIDVTVKAMLEDIETNGGHYHGK